MTGRIGGRASAGSHSAADQEPAASTTRRGSVLGAVGGRDPGQTAPSSDRRPSTSAISIRPPAASKRGDERRDQRPRIDGGLVRRVHAAAAAGAEPGLELAAGARRQPFGVEPERAHQLEAAPQLGRLVAVERDVQRAELEVADLAPGSPRRARPRTRPEPVRGERQLEQAVLAPGRLADRRQHPGGDVGGAGAGTVALDHEHLEPALGRAPGAGEADHAGADDDRVGSLSTRRAATGTSSFPGGGPRSPCAGITRIRFRRSAARRRPLSPLGRAPVPLQDTPRDELSETRDRRALLRTARRRATSTPRWR